MGYPETSNRTYPAAAETIVGVPVAVSCAPDTASYVPCLQLELIGDVLFVRLRQPAQIGDLVIVDGRHGRHGGAAWNR
jgi:hypothetical protein